MKTINKVCELVIVPEKGESLEEDFELDYYNHNIYLNRDKVYLH